MVKNRLFTLSRLSTSPTVLRPSPLYSCPRTGLPSSTPPLSLKSEGGSMVTRPLLQPPSLYSDCPSTPLFPQCGLSSVPPTPEVTSPTSQSTEFLPRLPTFPVTPFPRLSLVPDDPFRLPKTSDRCYSPTIGATYATLQGIDTSH